MDIQKSTTGQVLHSPKGYRAFLPHPLPPTLLWSKQLVCALSRADFALGQLARESCLLSDSHNLKSLFVTREAVLSSRIEGTRTSISDLLAYNAGVSVKQDADDLLEVQNYLTALDFGMQRLSELPLSLRLIKEIHERLMQGVRGAHATPGEFRKNQNWIGSPGCTLETAKFVPPPADKLITCLSDFEMFCHDRQLPPLIHIALCHYQFETIHPFLDGNGRIGRLLVSLLLTEQGMLPLPLLYLSAFFEATRDEYYRQLFSVSRDGTWQDWLIYFLNGIATQAQDALSRSERINTLLTKWKRQAESTASSVPVDIIEYLTVNPYFTIKGIAEELGVAYSTAERGVRRLLGENIISQVGGHMRDKVYCAIEILSILDEPALTV